MTAPPDNNNGHNGEGEAVRIATESARRTEKANAQTRRLEFILVVVAAVAALGAVAFSGWNSYRTREFGRIIADCTTPGGKCYEAGRKSNNEFRQMLLEKIDDVGECQTLQILLHRDANERAHTLNAKVHGYVYTSPTVEVPPPVPEELLHACDQFLKR